MLDLDELASALTVRSRGLAVGAAPSPATAASPAAGDKKEGKEKKKKEEKTVKEKPTWGAPGTSKAKKEEKAKDKKKEPEEKIPFVETPHGQKKDLSQPMAKEYDPECVEHAWAAWWEKEGFFTPNADDAINTCDSQKFVMVIPPPNVTGTLHLGHALTCAIEDALTRWHRMCGHQTLWVPGTDHAGIATQSVVERLLYKKEKITRHDLGREKFLERVWDWKTTNGNRITTQLRRVAASVDWTRESFTMDKKLSRAVEEAFIRFHDQGLIYRDNRLVNWCPHLRTALSDLEVDHEDIPGKTMLTIPGYDEKVEVGVLCEFKYHVKGGGADDFLVVATTRLETMLGDTAVAVHPDDDRYKKFHGKELVHPFYPKRKMIVVADGQSADMTFGTGCVKITPAHDPNDFRCGVRNKLEQINIFTEDGNINDIGGEFAGQHRYKARTTIEEALKKKGMWVGKKSHAMRLGLCSRSKDIIEPFLKPQWWMNCKELAARSVAAVREGDLKIVPEFHHDTWYRWLENIQEWCISRQLWWGHQIPAYKVVKPEQKTELWFTGKSEAEAMEKAKKHLGVKDVEVKRDEDVLDTWFSSGLFPFSVMGWPDCTDKDFNAFFPTSLLETGHDILFFWVARMVMMSLGLTGKLPFHTVYLHAMVRDAHGRKMSKSLGNVIDPLEVIEGISLDDLNKKLYEGNLPEKEIQKAVEGQSKDFPDGIPQCGADALRFGLLAYTLQGRNVNLDINRVVGYRHFCNKVWQGTRFGATYFGDDYKYPGFLEMSDKLAWEDKWIIARLSYCADKSNQAFENYEFANVTTACYNFFYYDLCGVYLELLKPRFYDKGEETVDEDGEKKVDAKVEADRKVARDVLYTCLDRSYRLMHPVLPFLTEELYQRLPPSPARLNSITKAPYPTVVAAWYNDQIETDMEIAKDIAAHFRSLKTSLGLAMNSRPKCYIRHQDDDISKSMGKITSQIASMGLVGETIMLRAGESAPAGTLREVVNDKCLTFLEADMSNLESVVEKVKKKLATAESKIKTYQGKAEAMQKMTEEQRTASAAVFEQHAKIIEETNREANELKLTIASIEEAMKGGKKGGR